MDNLEMVKKYGGAIPEENRKEFEKEFRKTYKHENEVSSIKVELGAVKEQLAERDKDIEKLKTDSGNLEALKAQLAQLQEKYAEDTQALSERLSSQMMDSRIELALTKAQAKNITAAKALLDLDKIKLDDGEMSGLEEQIKALCKNEPYLFSEEPRNPPPPVAGGTAAPPNLDTSNMEDYIKARKEL